MKQLFPIFGSPLNPWGMIIILLYPSTIIESSFLDYLLTLFFQNYLLTYD